MNINDWTRSLQIWLQIEAIFTGTPEYEQAQLMVGSILTTLEQDMSAAIMASACHMNGLSMDKADAYKAIFAAHAQNSHRNRSAFAH